MSTYNFTIVNNSLRVEVDTTGGDFNPRANTFKSPSFALVNSKIKFYESGIYVMALSFTEFGTIDGVSPTDLEDALDLLDAATANFNGGGIAPEILAALSNSDNPSETNAFATEDWVLANTPQGLFLGSVTPTDTPTGTGESFWVATEEGTYTDFGGIVVNPNSYAFISRDASNNFSITQTEINLATTVIDEGNLYNSENNVVGKEINTSNVEVDRASEAYTVVNIDKQVISVSGLPSGATFARYYIFLNASNVVTGTGSIETSKNSATITAPAGSTVFKLNLTGRNATGLSNLGNVRIENGNKINPINEKIFKIDNKELLINEVLPTQGLETIVFGDSITETLTSGGIHKTNWISYTQDYLNINFTNYARSGARVRGVYTLNDRTKLATQVADAIAEKGSDDVKLIIFNIMTNDTDSSANTSNFATAIVKPLLIGLDLTQFADALRHAFWSVSLQWPNAKIYACTPLRRVTGYNETNTNTQMGILIQMANFYNIKIIDQFNEVGISPQFEVNGGAGRYLSDGLHPNETGKKKQGLFIANEIIKDFKFKILY